MIAADFVAEAPLEIANPRSWLSAFGRLYRLLPDPQNTEFLEQIESSQ
jgi:hypothetical protein